METNNTIFSSYPSMGTRLQNKKNLLNLIAKSGSISRSQLSSVTGLTPPSVSKITRAMIEDGILLEAGTAESTGKVGRKEINLSVNPNSAYVIGISLTANRPNIVLCNAIGETVDSQNLSDLNFLEINKTIITIVSRIKNIVFDNSIDKKKLLGIGISAASSPGSTADFLVSLPLGWKKVNLREQLERELNLPIKIEPRSSALLKAEISQQEKPEDMYLINVALNTGVSAYLGGNIFNPMSNGFGSVSHLILDAQGPLCLHCGRKGCFETLASGISIVNLVEKLDNSNKNKDQQLHSLISEADNDNTKIKKIFFNAGRNLAKGVDSIMTLLNPSTVIVAGEVGRQKDYSKGARSMLHELKYKNTEDFLKFSSITSDEAAKSVALDEFVFSKLFDIERLRMDNNK